MKMVPFEGPLEPLPVLLQQRLDETSPGLDEGLCDETGESTPEVGMATEVEPAAVVLEAWQVPHEWKAKTTEGCIPQLVLRLGFFSHTPRFWRRPVKLGGDSANSDDSDNGSGSGRARPLAPQRGCWRLESPLGELLSQLRPSAVAGFIVDRRTEFAPTLVAGTRRAGPGGGQRARRSGDGRFTSPP